MTLSKNKEKHKILYMFYHRKDDEIKGSEVQVDESMLVSIRLLRNDIALQKQLIEQGEHFSNEIEHFEGYLFCKEGLFTWNPEIENYVKLIIEITY